MAIDKKEIQIRCKACSSRFGFNPWKVLPNVHCAIRIRRG